MQTVTFNEKGLFIPAEILQSFGWQLGSTFTVNATDNQLNLVSAKTEKQTLATKSTQNEIDAWVNQAYGMIKIDPNNAPKTKLEDFDVAEHITLFDSSDD